MPYLGHTDNKTPCTEDVMCVRARLHIHTGRRRLREGKISLGIVTLYDALYSAMQWYVACHDHRDKLITISSDNLNDESVLFDILVRSGIITYNFDYSTFSELVDSALYKDMSDYDYSGILKDIESIIAQLIVVPLDAHDTDDPAIS
ncbi:MAG: hypothetical protein HZC49_13450 [Nitrospirae bacterium]|nr:hypothetical protein [Nitrospirota bacterium]